MAFSIFNEAFYRRTNLDVDAAVRAGIFASGLAHFQTMGLFEGRTSVSPFFNDADYRRRYVDIDSAVGSGILVSGLQHFVISGETEGRTFNDYFSESSYRRRNPDVDQVVRSGLLPSGLAHYMNQGRYEGRSVGPFNEFYYTRDTRWANRDVAIAVNQDRLLNGFEHYEKAGKFEGRIGRFGGTSENDRIVATGGRTQISGLDSVITECIPGTTRSGGQCIDWANLGIAQIDTLVGGEGSDTFVASESYVGKNFGSPQSLCVQGSTRSGGQCIDWANLGIAQIDTLRSFYDEAGNNDYMRIEQFDPDHDRLLLGLPATDYTMIAAEDRLEIYHVTAVSSSNFSKAPTAMDLVAVIDNPNRLTFDLGQVIVRS